MTKYRVASCNEKRLYLAYTASAMFDIYDVLKDGQQVTDVLVGTKDTFPTFCKVVAIMAGYGERIRRTEGHLAEEPVSAESLMLVDPVEYLELKREALAAVMCGYHKDIQDEDEVDIGLAELQKKTDRQEHI